MLFLTRYTVKDYEVKTRSTKSWSMKSETNPKFKCLNDQNTSKDFNKALMCLKLLFWISIFGFRIYCTLFIEISAKGNYSVFGSKCSSWSNEPQGGGRRTPYGRMRHELHDKFFQKLNSYCEGAWFLLLDVVKYLCIICNLVYNYRL